MDERRRHARFPSSTIVECKRGFFAPSEETMTKDVGLGGVCFFSEHKMRVGQMVRLKLFYDEKSPAKIMKGRIVWSRRWEDKISNGYINGVAFVR